MCVCVHTYYYTVLAHKSQQKRARLMKINTELTMVEADSLQKAVASELNAADKNMKELLAKLDDEDDESERTNAQDDK